ncbi:hypothetical protein FGIG_00388 [Fasciola gigantica]|uniref:Uncharacterized protein n=1 Tax=Fasciola gigantica TaxID=46835 RepID=A0A504YE89_FASGI|nr:hypothetical protein FGIG_00388 [Fasciola gigantica]
MPQYANFVIRAHSHSGTGSYTVLAHSLALFDTRHGSRFTSSLSSHDPFSGSLDERPLHLDRIEGTARGLLLDVIGLPVIDRVAMLTIIPSDRHSSSRRAPTTIAHNAISCAPLSEFWRTFCNVVRLWATTLPPNSSVVPLDTHDAFLVSLSSELRIVLVVDHLTLKMSARDSLPTTLSDNLLRFRLTRRCLACVLDSRLYMDSTLGADLLARLASLSIETTASVTFLTVGLMDDPGLMDSVSRLRRGLTHSLYASLADFVCPLGGSDKIALKHFLRGFLNELQSVARYLHVNTSFGRSSSSSVVIQRLQSYLTSHGIRRMYAVRLLRSICETKQPSTPPSLPRASATSKSRSQRLVTEHTARAPAALMEPGETGIQAISEPCLSTVADVDCDELVSSSSQSTHSEPDHSPPRSGTSTENVLSHDRVSWHSVPYSAVSNMMNDTLFGKLNVECNASQWDSILERVSDEVTSNIIRVTRRPSFSEGGGCQPGLLSVGPIFLEVKSTAGAITADRTTDLFEISLSEVMCAVKHSWRYHLLRVTWERGADGSPQLQVAPRITHTPDLATELRQHSPALKLCCAMLRVNPS